MAERLLPKQNVESSNLFTRSSSLTSSVPIGVRQQFADFLDGVW